MHRTRSTDYHFQSNELWSFYVLVDVSGSQYLFSCSYRSFLLVPEDWIARRTVVTVSTKEYSANNLHRYTRCTVFFFFGCGTSCGFLIRALIVKMYNRFLITMNTSRSKLRMAGRFQILLVGSLASTLKSYYSFIWYSYHVEVTGKKVFTFHTAVSIGISPTSSSSYPLYTPHHSAGDG